MDKSGVSEKIRVVLVDDHPSYAKGLALLLESTSESIEVVGTATRSEAAIELIEAQLPDIVLMDIQIPNQDGIEITKQIRSRFPVVKVMMLTVSDEDRDIYEAMKAGASGYLRKQVEVEELVIALTAIHQGQVVVSPEVAGKLLAGEEVGPLSDLERELLRLVAEGHDNAAIGKALSVSESTVKRNLRNIVEKLELHNRVEAAVYAARKGWI